jgi:hypothetical protein
LLLSGVRPPGLFLLQRGAHPPQPSLPRHGVRRYQAAKQLGLDKVPVIVVAGLSPARQRALAIADNKIAQNAGWNRELIN